MKVANFRMERQIAFCLVAMLLAPVSTLAATVPQAASAVGSAPSAEASHTAASGQATASPAPTTAASTPATSPSQGPPGTPSQDPPKVPAQAADQSQQAGTVPSTSPQQQTPAPAALGTAAAPYETQSGVSGSKPAGAAIAPGKQRRTRSFAIRVALLVGAAVAIGVVTAASLSSPNRPN